MNESDKLHAKADRLFELARILIELREFLLEEGRQVRFNAELQRRTEMKDNEVVVEP